MTDVTCALPAGALLGEGALWDPGEQRLYWVDIKRQEVHRFDPARGHDERWVVPEAVGCLAVRAAGGLVVALRSGFHSFDPSTGRTVPLATPEPERTDNRFNDGKTDRQGRFWAGSMHDPETKPTGSLYRLDGDLSCHRLLDGLVVPNALCWSPDSRTMYQADSSRGTVWAWDFDATGGGIANRRTFVEIPASEGGPDGATVDADGFVWLAHWGGGRLSRFDPAGRLERVVPLPVQRPTCPAFGGPGLDVLYVTSASIGLSTEERTRQPWAGSILAIDAGVRGLPEARFRG
jgi:L-arabinonolactonase